MRHQASLLALIFFASVATSAIAQPEKCTIRDLPKGIADIIRSKYAGWKPEQISDLSSDDRELWVKAHSNSCPGITSGHFDVANRVEYAVLIVKNGNRDGGYKLLIFRQDSSGSLNVNTLTHAEGVLGSGPVISHVPPGEYSDPESGKSVKTKLDSVLLEWIEAAAQLYYWTGTKFQKLQVED